MPIIRTAQVRSAPGTPLVLQVRGDNFHAGMKAELILGARRYPLAMISVDATSAQMSYPESLEPGSYDLVITNGPNSIEKAEGRVLIPSPAKDSGKLTLTSDPPGLLIVVDDRATVKTPISLELFAGNHSIEPLAQRVPPNWTWYEAQPTQTVSIQAGSELTIPIKLSVAKAQLQILHAPAGYRVFVNAEDRGQTPIGTLDVPAQKLIVRFEREGDTERDSSIMYADPNQILQFIWGRERNTAVPLEQRSVQLHGTPDTWGDLEPLFETDIRSKWPGEDDYSVRSFYICRDDTYLYWRVDFFKTNPFWEIPQDAKGGVNLQLYVNSFEYSRNIKMDIKLQGDAHQAYCDLGIWNDDTSSYFSEPRNATTVEQSESMLVARMKLEDIERYCRGPQRLNYQMATLDDKGNSMFTVSQTLGWVDFPAIVSTRPK